MAANAEALLPALRAALDGTGPAVLPVPPDDRGRLVTAMRLQDPLEDDVALVVPTSGSTGEPKGVLLSAANLHASAQATAERLGGHGQWLLALPPTHIGGVQVLVRSLLAATAPQVLHGSGPATFSAATCGLGSGRRYVSLVPTQLLRLLSTAAPALREYDAVLLGGAAADPALLTRARELDVRVVTTYGMSETAGGCVYDGRPLSGVRVELDADGRIRLGGAVVAQGYRLRDDPDLAGGEFLTRDAGRWHEDGTLQVLGRIDDMVITGGVNVAPDAVEAVLRTHADVADAGVVGVPDPHWGQRVRAVVVAVPGAAVTLEALREHVARQLPRSWAPHELVLLDVLPRTSGGKIDRRALRSQPPTGQPGQEP